VKLWAELSALCKLMYNLIGQTAVRDESAAKFDYRPVGYGKQDIPAIVAAAEDAGCGWLIVEQDRCSMGRTPLQCAEMSIKYLKSFL
jgi:sugar phosphate isomerase/epimerase